MQGINEHKADIITQLQMQKEQGGGVCATWILQKSCDSFIRLLEYVECYHRRRMLYRTVSIYIDNFLAVYDKIYVVDTLYIRI